jgi:carbon-monoxide dehydrogenase small subunit
LIIAATVLLDQNPAPSDDEIKEAISGNLCRCTGYGPIIEAVKVAAEKLRGNAERQFGSSAPAELAFGGPTVGGAR